MKLLLIIFAVGCVLDWVHCWVLNRRAPHKTKRPILRGIGVSRVPGKDAIKSAEKIKNQRKNDGIRPYKQHRQEQRNTTIPSPTERIET